MMTLKELNSVGRMLTSFLMLFSMCFRRRAGRDLLRFYVQGQLSDIQRNNCEAIALKFGQSPRTLQRFLESIKWDEERLRDRCQEIVAQDHGHPEAIGLIDESGKRKEESERGHSAFSLELENEKRKGGFIRGPGTFWKSQHHVSRVDQSK